MSQSADPPPPPTDTLERRQLVGASPIETSELRDALPPRPTSPTAPKTGVSPCATDSKSVADLFAVGAADRSGGQGGTQSVLKTEWDLPDEELEANTQEAQALIPSDGDEDERGWYVWGYWLITTWCYQIFCLVLAILHSISYLAHDLQQTEESKEDLQQVARNVTVTGLPLLIFSVCEVIIRVRREAGPFSRCHTTVLRFFKPIYHRFEAIMWIVMIYRTVVTYMLVMIAFADASYSEEDVDTATDFAVIVYRVIRMWAVLYGISVQVTENAISRAKHREKVWMKDHNELMKEYKAKRIVRLETALDSHPVQALLLGFLMFHCILYALTSGYDAFRTYYWFTEFSGFCACCAIFAEFFIRVCAQNGDQFFRITWHRWETLFCVAGFLMLAYATWYHEAIERGESTLAPWGSAMLFVLLIQRAFRIIGIINNVSSSDFDADGVVAAKAIAAIKTRFEDLVEVPPENVKFEITKNAVKVEIHKAVLRPEAFEGLHLPVILKGALVEDLRISIPSGLSGQNDPTQLKLRNLLVIAGPGKGLGDPDGSYWTYENVLEAKSALVETLCKRLTPPEQHLADHEAGRSKDEFSNLMKMKTALNQVKKSIVGKAKRAYLAHVTVDIRHMTFQFEDRENELGMGYGLTFGARVGHLWMKRQQGTAAKCQLLRAGVYLEKGRKNNIGGREKLRELDNLDAVRNYYRKTENTDTEAKPSKPKWPSQGWPSCGLWNSATKKGEKLTTVAPSRVVKEWLAEHERLTLDMPSWRTELLQRMQDHPREAVKLLNYQEAARGIREAIAESIREARPRTGRQYHHHMERWWDKGTLFSLTRASFSAHDQEQGTPRMQTPTACEEQSQGLDPANPFGATISDRNTVSSSRPVGQKFAECKSKSWVTTTTSRASRLNKSANDEKPSSWFYEVRTTPVRCAIDEAQVYCIMSLLKNTKAWGLKDSAFQWRPDVTPGEIGMPDDDRNFWQERRTVVRLWWLYAVHRVLAKQNIKPKYPWLKVACRGAAYVHYKAVLRDIALRGPVQDPTFRLPWKELPNHDKDLQVARLRFLVDRGEARWLKELQMHIPINQILDCRRKALTIMSASSRARHQAKKEAAVHAIRRELGQVRSMIMEETKQKKRIRRVNEGRVTQETALNFLIGSWDIHMPFIEMRMMRTSTKLPRPLLLHPKLRDLRIEAEFDIKAAHPPGALHAAAEENNIELLSLLLRQKADANDVDAEGKTALQVAEENGLPDIAQILKPVTVANRNKDQADVDASMASVEEGILDWDRFDKKPLARAALTVSIGDFLIVCPEAYHSDGSLDFGAGSNILNITRFVQTGRPYDHAHQLMPGAEAGKDVAFCARAALTSRTAGMCEIYLPDFRVVVYEPLIFALLRYGKTKPEEAMSVEELDESKKFEAAGRARCNHIEKVDRNPKEVTITQPRVGPFKNSIAYRKLDVTGMSELRRQLQERAAYLATYATKMQSSKKKASIFERIIGVAGLHQDVDVLMFAGAIDCTQVGAFSKHMLLVETIRCRPFVGRGKRAPELAKEGDTPPESMRAKSKGTGPVQDVTQLAVKVGIVSAKNLRNADLLSKSDPFCTLEIEGMSKEFGQTETLDNTLDPVWQYDTWIKDMPLGRNLLFKVWDDDARQAETLGVATLNWHEFMPFDFKDMPFCLLAVDAQQGSKEIRVTDTQGFNPGDEIQIGLSRGTTYEIESISSIKETIRLKTPLLVSYNKQLVVSMTQARVGLKQEFELQIDDDDKSHNAVISVWVIVVQVPKPGPELDRAVAFASECFNEENVMDFMADGWPLPVHTSDVFKGVNEGSTSASTSPRKQDIVPSKETVTDDKPENESRWTWSWWAGRSTSCVGCPSNSEKPMYSVETMSAEEEQEQTIHTTAFIGADNEPSILQQQMQDRQLALKEMFPAFEASVVTHPVEEIKNGLLWRESAVWRATLHGGPSQGLFDQVSKDMIDSTSPRRAAYRTVTVRTPFSSQHSLQAQDSPLSNKSSAGPRIKHQVL